jgi:hypothetical protein
LTKQKRIKRLKEGKERERKTTVKKKKEITVSESWQHVGH